MGKVSKVSKISCFIRDWKRNGILCHSLESVTELRLLLGPNTISFFLCYKFLTLNIKHINIIQVNQEKASSGFVKFTRFLIENFLFLFFSQFQAKNHTNVHGKVVNGDLPVRMSWHVIIESTPVRSHLNAVIAIAVFHVPIIWHCIWNGMSRLDSMCTQEQKKKKTKQN